VITDDELRGLEATMRRFEGSFRADLARLVNIDCGTYTKSGVDQVAAFVAERMRDLGADVRTVTNADYGDIVVGTFRGAGSLNALAIGHMDTVFDEGTVAERPYTVRDGRAHGPGTDDMKGGLLAALYALQSIRDATGGSSRSSWLPFRTLTFVANPDEEIGSPTSTPVIREAAAGADVAFVLEAARENGNIVSARKGIGDFIVTLHGRAAHAGVEPHKGRSAIVEAAHKTLALAALNGRWPGVTVNVGVVHGGTRPNVVAEQCQIEIDLRGTTAAEMAEAEAAIRAIAAETTVPDVTAVVERKHFWPPFEKGAGTAALADLAIELGRRLGLEFTDQSTGGASDANTTSGLGVPTLDGLGPVGGNAHSAEEYLELDSIVPRTTLLAALLLSAARGD